MNLSRMRLHAGETMLDTCIVHRRTTASGNAYGIPGATYTAGQPVQCGYKARSSREVQQGNETVIVDAELRLPHGTAISSLDRVEITHRYGDTLNPTLLFNVIGQPAQGISAVVVSLATTHE